MVTIKLWDPELISHIPQTCSPRGCVQYWERSSEMPAPISGCPSHPWVCDQLPLRPLRRDKWLQFQSGRGSVWSRQTHSSSITCLHYPPSIDHEQCCNFTLHRTKPEIIVHEIMKLSILLRMRSYQTWKSWCGCKWWEGWCYLQQSLMLEVLPQPWQIAGPCRSSLGGGGLQTCWLGSMVLRTLERWGCIGSVDLAPMTVYM